MSLDLDVTTRDLTVSSDILRGRRRYRPHRIVSSAHERSKRESAGHSPRCANRCTFSLGSYRVKWGIARMNEKSRSEMVTVFQRRTAKEHMAGVLREWKSLCITASVVFGVIWGVAEATAYFLDISFRGWRFFGVAVSVSLLAGIARAIYVYVHSCPPGLEHESREARHIAQLQAPLWEFRLARQLLDEKLSVLDGELDDLLQNRVLVPVTRQVGLDEFAQWAQLRIGTLQRMLEVAQQLLIVEFPAALKSRPEQRADPSRIVGVIDKIRALYSDTVTYERETHATETAEVLRGACQLMHGWSSPIRSGIQQMKGFLDKILSLDPRGSHRVEYTIVFPELPNQQELDVELARVLAQLGMSPSSS